MQTMEKDVKVFNDDMLVFLAEDDEEDIFLFKLAIAELQLRCKLLLFKNGDDLLNAMVSISSAKPDIIFLDINMPIKNGFEALVVIRNEISRQIPVFLLSTADDRLTVEEGRKAGATGFLSKPGTVQELSNLLKTIFSVNWETRSVADFYVHLSFCDKISD